MRRYLRLARYSPQPIGESFHWIRSRLVFVVALFAPCVLVGFKAVLSDLVEPFSVRLFLVGIELQKPQRYTRPGTSAGAAIDSHTADDQLIGQCPLIERFESGEWS